MKTVVNLIIVVFVALSIWWAIEEFANKPVVYERPTATSSVEVIIRSDFEDTKRRYMESEEGAQVLDTWATQKALDEMREQLDTVEAEMLEREASL